MSVPAFVAAAQSRDADGARAALSPAFAGKANGKPLDRDAQVRLLESFWAGFPDGAFAMEPTGGSGRHVITWTFKGTHGGVYLGVPPTEKPVEFSGFIIAVSDATGVTSLDWKWDTKVFTKAVLGPDDVGSLEVRDHFRADPSRRWSHGHGGHGQGPGGPRRKKGKGKPGQPGQPGQPRQPRPDGGVRVEGGEAAPPQPPALGPDGQPLPQQPGQGKRRRRRGKGPRPQGDAPDQPPMTTPNPPSEPAAASEPSAPSAAPSGEPKPEGT